MSGGKLTTFRPMAVAALKLAAPRLAMLAARGPARDGPLLAAAQPGELGAVPGTPTLWAELRWAARTEAVCGLDDLLLRRVRIGLVLTNGAAALLPQVRAIVQPELGWNDATWQTQEARYRAGVAQSLALPAGSGPPEAPA